jgi:hypothetical protein
MTLDWIQDATVTAAAMLAAGVILRRVLTTLRPARNHARPCSSCAGRPACADGPSTVAPLTFSASKLPAQTFPQQ